MHMRRFLIYSLVSLVGIGVMAQTSRDALIHTQTRLTGTARTLGMGGAFSAVGADLSAATLNPAGLGLYRSSSFVITPEINFVSNRANYLDVDQQSSQNTARVSSLAFAFNNINYTRSGRERKEVQDGLVSYTVAFGYHNLEHYNRTMRVDNAFNPFSSITNGFAEAAAGISASELIAFQEFQAESYPELYWNTFSIDAVPGDSTSYYPAVNDGRISQTLQVRDEGRRNEWFGSIGANISNQLFIGATVSLQVLRYDNLFEFREDDLDSFHEVANNNLDFGPIEFPTETLTFEERFTTRGNGINGKLGIIYRPVDAFRVGVSVTTPTIFSLTDRIIGTRLAHTYALDTTENSLITLVDSLADGEFDYTLSTPFRAKAGFMFLLGKQGFLAADIEYVDYRGATFDSGSGSINDPNSAFNSQLNQEVDDLYQPALNVNVGGEARFDMFRVRAGVAYHSNPLSAEGQAYLSLDQVEANDYRDLIGEDAASLVAPADLDASRLFFTLGAGIRQPNFFLDVSLVNQRQQDKLSPYAISADDILQPNVINRLSANRVALSLGFNW